MKENKTIELSGRVYLSGILAEDYSQWAPPAVWLTGDIKLHNVHKGGKRPRFGQTISFAGFIVASVYDGKNFRRFLLRKRGAVESTYQGPVGRRECSVTITRYLRTLVRRQAVWSVEQSGYQVTSSVPAPPPVAVAPAVKAAAPVAKAEVVPTPAASPVVVTTACPTRRDASKAVKARRGSRRRTKAVDPNQLPLF